MHKLSSKFKPRRRHCGMDDDGRRWWSVAECNMTINTFTFSADYVQCLSRDLALPPFYFHVVFIWLTVFLAALIALVEGGLITSLISNLSSPQRVSNIPGSVAPFRRLDESDQAAAFVRKARDEAAASSATMGGRG